MKSAACLTRMVGGSVEGCKMRSRGAVGCPPRPCPLRIHQGRQPFRAVLAASAAAAEYARATSLAADVATYITSRGALCSARPPLPA